MELINIYKDLKNKYRNYDTRDALKCMQAFRRASRDLGKRGYLVGLELFGSLNFGIVESHSDADLILLHYCSLHRKDGECMPDCSNLKLEREAIAKGVAKHLKIEHFDIETLDCINLHYISDCITNGLATMHDDIVLRFLFYCEIGRPVNRPIFIKQYKTLAKEPGLSKYFITWASDILASYLQTSSHRLSFHKYNERIASRGLQLPEGLRQELKHYLD